MKKIALIIVATFAAQIAFGRWYSDVYNNILADLGEKYFATPFAVELYGFFNGKIWTPPYATLNPITWEFEADNIEGNSVIVTRFADLNNRGKYDYDLSLNNFKDKCAVYLSDEFGQPYTVYDDNFAGAFFKEYESKNYNAARTALMDLLNDAVTKWGKDGITGTMTQAGQGVQELVEKTKKMSEELKDESDKVKEAIDKTKQTAENLNQEIEKVQKDLTKISEEAVYNAQKQIDSAVSDFNSFVTTLENAISKGEWDDTMFEASFNELTKSEQDLVDAIKQLQQSSQAPEVQNTIKVLGGQLTGIRSLKTSLRAAIDAKDIDAARGVLNAARGMSSFYNSRAAVSKVNNRVKSLKSEIGVLGVLADTALTSMKDYDAMKADLDRIRANFSFMFITAMDNFHQINAYLGSTNSMAYVIKRESANDLSDFTIDELEQWVKISAPDNIDDRYGFGASQLGGRRWNFIYDNLASTYTMWAWPLVKDDDGEPQPGFLKFMEHFNLSGLAPRYKGFVESINYDSEEHPQTNWVANGITAPKNWADGKTIIVTNGHYVVVGGSGARVDNVSITTNTIYGAVANGNVSVYGFSTAENGSVPYKTVGGKVGWTTNSVDGGGLLMLKTDEAPSTVDIIAGYGMEVTKQSGAIKISSTLDTPDSAGAFSSITYISNIEYDTETHSLKVTKTTVSAKILNDGTSQEQTVFIATPHSAEHPSELK